MPQTLSIFIELGSRSIISWLSDVFRSVEGSVGQTNPLAAPLGLRTMVGTLITLLTLACCVLPFVLFSVASGHRVSLLGIAGRAGGFAVAMVLIYLDAPDYYPTAPWRIIGYEYLEHGELRIPLGIIAPLTILGGIVAFGCRRMFASRPVGQQ